MELFGNIIGHIAVVCFLVAYFMLQKGTWKPDNLWYLTLNLSGALLIMGSLLISWNLSAFILEACWGLISIYGLIKYYKARHLK